MPRVKKPSVNGPKELARVDSDAKLFPEIIELIEKTSCPLNFAAASFGLNKDRIKLVLDKYPDIRLAVETARAKGGARWFSRLMELCDSDDAKPRDVMMVLERLYPDQFAERKTLHATGPMSEDTVRSEPLVTSAEDARKIVAAVAASLKPQG